MNIWTQEDFKNYLLYVKQHNESLSEKQQEWIMVWDKYYSMVLRPSDEWYYERYINNILT